MRLNPNRLLEPVQILFVEHIACLILEGVAGYVERIRQAICSTSKRKMNRKRWKQPKKEVSGLTTDWG